MGYMASRISVSPKVLYVCQGFVTTNPDQAGPPPPETVGAVFGTQHAPGVEQSGMTVVVLSVDAPVASAKSRVHLLKYAPVCSSFREASGRR